MPQLLLEYRETDAIGHGLLEAETERNMPDLPNLSQGFRSINVLLSTWRKFRTSIFSCKPSQTKMAYNSSIQGFLIMQQAHSYHYWRE
jgi:hypothetical protein